MSERWRWPVNERMRPWLTDEDKAAVAEVLDSGDLMSGKRVQTFEEVLASYFGKRHAVCVSSGTAALECAFVASGLPRSLSPNGYIAIANAAQAAQAAQNAARDITSSAFTDVLGEMADHVGEVHDCAHRFDREAARADLSCFSFNANKFIACVGGAVLTNDSAAAAIMRQYRNHGRDGGPEIFRDGRNHRMGEINAALGLSQMKRIIDILARRKQVARWYDEITGQDLADTRESWFLYPVHKPGHKHRSLADFRLFNTATQEDRDTALLPIWPLMTREDCEAVCSL